MHACMHAYLLLMISTHARMHACTCRYFKAQGHMLAHADDVIANLSLVRDYQRRPVMAKRMSGLVDDVNYFANAVRQ